MKIFGFEIKNKEKERAKMREYKKKNYKVFTFAVPSDEYEEYKEFFRKKGGFSKFVREAIENEKSFSLSPSQ